MSQRVDRVSEAIKRELGQLLVSGLKDSRLSSNIISITEVEVTRDLRHVKIFVSVFGNKKQQKDVMDGFISAKGFIRSEIGKRVRLRFTPEISFALDDSLEKGDKILQLLNKVSSEESETESVDE